MQVYITRHGLNDSGNHAFKATCQLTEHTGLSSSTLSTFHIRLCLSRLMIRTSLCHMARTAYTITSRSILTSLSFVTFKLTVRHSAFTSSRNITFSNSPFGGLRDTCFGVTHLSSHHTFYHVPILLFYLNKMRECRQ